MNNQSIKWPLRYDLFGVKVSAVDYKGAEEVVIQAAKRGEAAIVAHMPVHGLMTAVADEHFRNALNGLDMVCPDGHPVRWALNSLYKTKLIDRVYGPDLMLMLCRRAVAEKISIYLYGSTEAVLAALKENLVKRFPGLVIAGAESPPFRRLTAEEDLAMVGRINGSGARLVFLGLGCPRQELFAFEHKDKIRAVQLCVGAAFDFIAGTKPQAPAWMRKNGLEWLFRLVSEPVRLGPRYFVTNTRFLLRFALTKIRSLKRPATR
ncbi:MAG: WecB/TagA/CpsF family glycosyltransferase [Chitinispirillaceae bacterium]|nr:WecB/TagA/CpsF family glycosyltransferase [Chitinispirillaceae bacterium]